MGNRKIKVGQTASCSKKITEEDISAFAEITDDRNPLHINEEFASKSRFGGKIAHGMLTAGLISAVLGTKMPGPGSIYLSQTLEFIKPVRIGDTIKATVKVIQYREDKGIVILDTRCLNQNNIEVLRGEAKLLVMENQA